MVGEAGTRFPPGTSISINAGVYSEAAFLNKQLELRAVNGAVTIGPPSLAPFDLVVEAVDDNGLPLNPKWGDQVRLGTPPDPLRCPDEEPDDPSCTNHFTYRREGLCGFEHHENWFAATYDTTFGSDGNLTWELHSCPATHIPPDDDDYTMNLTRPDHAGYASTRNNIHIEFDSGETIDRFVDDCAPNCSHWWSDFKTVVDRDDDTYGCGNHGYYADQFIGTPYAIVSGLVNFDTAHTVHVELHPVWALAINNPVYYSDWALFVRNWGNQGFCGRGQEFAYFPNNQYTFRLPWKPGSTLLDYSAVWSRYNTHRPYPEIRVVEGQAIYVTFFLDPPQDQGSMWDGELHLYWSP